MDQGGQDLHGAVLLHGELLQVVELTQVSSKLCGRFTLHARCKFQVTNSARQQIVTTDQSPISWSQILKIYIFEYGHDEMAVSTKTECFYFIWKNSS